MPVTDRLRFQIGNRDIEITDINAVPLAIDYALEDAEDFEKKQSSQAFNVTLPATQNNAQTFNAPANPNAEDLTSDDFFTSHQPCVIEANGVELLKGKAFLVEATHTDRPETITINAYGNNADWVIDLKEKTLLDFVNPRDHVFKSSVMEASWNYDGTSEEKDYVYAPVLYDKPFKNGVVYSEDLKPSISIYWILWRAFKSLGYRIESQFLDSAYFRKLVMPWTWGDYLYTDDVVQAPYLFRRVCTQQEKKTLSNKTAWNETVSPTSGSPVTQVIQWNDNSSKTNSPSQPDGGFDQQPALSGWNAPADLTYTYPANSVLGSSIAGFELQLYYYVYSNTPNSAWGLYVEWYVNGVLKYTDLAHQYNGGNAEEDSVLLTKELPLVPGDVVTLRIQISASNAVWNWRVGNTYALSQTNNYPPSHLWLRYFKKAIGSPVRLANYPAFKRYKWIDLLRGVADAYNLAIQTDPVTKTVFIEPTHDYGSGSTRTPGYLGKGTLEWTGKQDLSKESVMQLYSDCEREFDFKFKDDGADGGVSTLNKRHSVELGASRYLFPDRFKAGKKEFQNRFFSPVVHAPVEQWKGIANGVTPQLIALISENPDSTSGKVAQTFEPKLAYYKGLVTDAGGWAYFGTNPAQVMRKSLPYLFAVNYQNGGETDPVLTYNDQRIGSGTTIGEGLMRRFYLPRLAIMRHGRLYRTWFKLNTGDITNWLHREAIAVSGKRYFLINIDKYQPLQDETTAVKMWQWAPITEKDDAACYPSRDSVKATGATLGSSDLTYARQMLLSTDLPVDTTED